MCKPTADVLPSERFCVHIMLFFNIKQNRLGYRGAALTVDKSKKLKITRIVGKIHRGRRFSAKVTRSTRFLQCRKVMTTEKSKGPRRRYFLEVWEIFTKM